MNAYRVTFGHIEVGELGRRYLEQALSRNWVSEGTNVQLFEARFAGRFGYRHARSYSTNLPRRTNYAGGL